MKARLFTLALAIAITASFGCKGELPEEYKEAEKAMKDKPKKERANVVKVTTAVPYGKVVACADLVPDPLVFSQMIGDEIGEVKDRSQSNSEASAVCAFMKAGEPPKDNAQLKAYEKNAAKLGVLPGDEYCMITAYCSFATDADEFKTKCEADGDTINNNAVGVSACVHQSQRASEWAYTYKVIEPDTKCVIDVMGGPSVTDEGLVQNCTKAAIEAISMDTVKKYK
jgi:hypothetical protein